jgi:VIT1/CCC1 family predicted Fe2+/Mn2+ transporter
MSKFRNKTLVSERHRNSHTPEAIRQRLSDPQKHSYLSDAVLGGIDGCITTFAIVASAVGAGFPNLVALVLGLANVIADGFSMAASNYEAVKSREDFIAMTRKREERHIEIFPEGEQEEIRQIYAQKGFEGELLENIVHTITSDRKLWVETMLKDEHGLQPESPSAFLSALATFCAFMAVGIVPLKPL